MPKVKNPKNVYKSRARALWPILRFLGILLVLAIAGASITLLFLLKDLPRPEKFTESEIAQSSKLYARDGKTVLYEIAGDEKRTLVPLSQISSLMQQAIVAAEDQSFYQHRGVDLKGIARAILYDLKLQERAQGASTISQQLIRNYFLTANKTIKRKTREAVLALEMERRYSKEQILEWYLNLVPFGSNIYGVEEASRTFFDKSAADLSLPQAAALAALIKSPSSLWPYATTTKEELIGRQQYVLNQMAKQGVITEEEAAAAKEESLEFLPLNHPIKAPHFVMFVRNYLYQKYGEEFLSSSGLKIITSLDIDMQEAAETEVSNYSKGLAGYRANNAGLVALDPKTGEILAMVGSKDYFGVSSPNGCSPDTPSKTCRFDPQVNVTISLRQPGSAFKPIVYATAFEMGYSPDTILQDTLTEFNPNCPPDGSAEKDRYGLDCYHPNNYDGLFKGPISIRSALAQSRNVPAVKTLQFVGVANALEKAKEMGITTLNDTSRYGLALVLGGGEVKLLEMAGAYGTFARDGMRTPLNFILKIEDAKGDILEKAKTGSLRIISSQSSREINSILSDNAARTPMFGANSSLYLADYADEVAVKTGTTQNDRDAWTIGYTPNIVVGVWVGNNDNTSMTQSSVMVASPLWRNFMLKILPRLPREPLKI
ncbi:MAG: transglycosylase domain-containing protein [Candidatus Pacebacteria bacterium]|nr:transglycosylase domain-containing protein [Candidatus Paceibacterota bacterium]